MRSTCDTFFSKCYDALIWGDYLYKVL
uniref:Uncharacterized protein n=1 Tax=Anguilla anguilla TaxID=7936 RepID=A0A0E9QBQ0_ANGAN